jgi:hypothetical protein
MLVEDCSDGFQVVRVGQKKDRPEHQSACGPLAHEVATNFARLPAEWFPLITAHADQLARFRWIS